MMCERTAPVMVYLERVAQEIPGWSPADQLYALFSMVYLTAGLPGDVLELGSWCGRSSVALGLAAQLCGNTRVFCVDLFPGKNDWHQNEDGSYSMTVTLDGGVVKAYHQQTVWQEPFERDIAPLYQNHPGILGIFHENVARNELGQVIVSHKGTLASFLVARGLHTEFRLAFIDGDHGYDAVRNDICLVDNVLVPGGWICLDDAFTSYDGVNRAIEELILASPRYELGQQVTRKMFVARKRAAA